MGKLKLILFFSAIFFSFLKSSASEGCYIASLSTVYAGSYTTMGSGTGAYRVYTSGQPTSTTCPPASLQHAINLVPVTSTYMGFHFNITCTVGVLIGTTETYTIQACAIDDYVWVLLMPIGFIGFSLIRKRNLLIKN